MDGTVVLEKVSALRLEGIVDGDEISTTLLAAVFAEALRQGRPPRSVLDALWEALPADENWESVGTLMTEACDLIEEGGGG